MKKSVSIQIIGTCGSGKTSIFRLIESILKKHDIVVHYGEERDMMLEEREQHNKLITIDDIKTKIAPNINVVLSEHNIIKKSGV